MGRQTINAEKREEIPSQPAVTKSGSTLLKLGKVLLADKLNLWYTVFIFVNHFAYVSL